MGRTAAAAGILQKPAPVDPVVFSHGNLQPVMGRRLDRNRADGGKYPRRFAGQFRQLQLQCAVGAATERFAIRYELILRQIEPGNIGRMTRQCFVATDSEFRFRHRAAAAEQRQRQRRRQQPIDPFVHG
ncbi:hypothetical protein SDC9_118633 [bioreactor metagenome]|uniref:Uncharacterized protein n=1 Tax=bioreactor metagenome TaxID=1076179 RepID=A0A645C846_9ZZZZ